MKTRKKLMLFMATLLTALTVVMPLQTSAAERTTENATELLSNDLRCGLQPIEMIEISDEEALEMSRENADVNPATDDVDSVDEMTDEEIQEELLIYVEEKAAHATDASDWGAYCCDAIYDNMSATEKQFYNNMYADCYSYLTSTKTASSGYTDGAASSGLTQEQMINVALIFNFLNPQFYFIDSGFGYTGSMLKWAVYPQFCDGNARATATNNMFTVVNNYMAQINAQASNYDKLKVAHDLLANNVTYNTDTYDQSCYSSFVKGVSVCAGYSEAYELLCNKAGIPTIAVTSNDHEWNQVYLDNVWYFVDVTWDDGEPGVYDDYFLKSNATVFNYGSDDKTMHTLESLWSAYHVRDCLYDYPAPNGGVTQSFSDATGGTTVIPAGSVTMYRLYNPNSGEHFYTSSIAEKDNLTSVGWDYEGEAWIAPESSNTPVYRLYNPNSGEHHYTISTGERDTLKSIGWNDEGIGWYSDDSQTTPLYRLYNPNAKGAQEAGAHHYTTSEVERDSLASIGWNSEGIGWYGN